MRCDGDCMLPEIEDGALLMFEKELPRTGDLAAIVQRPDVVRGPHQVLVKRIVLLNDAQVLAEMNNPPTILFWLRAEILALHSFVAVMPKDHPTHIQRVADLEARAAH